MSTAFCGRSLGHKRWRTSHKGQEWRMKIMVLSSSGGRDSTAAQFHTVRTQTLLFCTTLATSTYSIVVSCIKVMEAQFHLPLARTCPPAPQMLLPPARWMFSLLIIIRRTTHQLLRELALMTRQYKPTTWDLTSQERRAMRGVSHTSWSTHLWSYASSGRQQAIPACHHQQSGRADVMLLLPLTILRSQSSIS